MKLAVFFFIGLYSSCAFGWKSFQLNWTLMTRKGHFTRRCTIPGSASTGCEVSQDNQGKSQFDNQSAEPITSPEIDTLVTKIEEVRNLIADIRLAKVTSEEEFKKLDDEFGPEVTRIKKEFDRIKERAIEEAVDSSNKAKAAALKEILPIVDTYTKARKLFEPILPGDEEVVDRAYNDVFTSFSNVIKEFGVEKVESLGKAFDARFMEAIQAIPSDEYADDVVCTEYQAGYRMGDTCVRPAMVAVSMGPGPNA